MARMLEDDYCKKCGEKTVRCSQCQELQSGAGLKLFAPPEIRSGEWMDALEKARIALDRLMETWPARKNPELAYYVSNGLAEMKNELQRESASIAQAQ
jgi:hypothetical protein